MSNDINNLQSFFTLTEKVLSKYINHTFIETGTYLGDSVELALKIGFEKIISIELLEELQIRNIKKFEKEISEGKVDLITGDTSILFNEIVFSLNKRATFWLDAHQDLGPQGQKKCPLYDELEAISNSSIKDHTILIDDMRCLNGNIHWSEGITLEGITERIKRINKNYHFAFESSPFGERDILVAFCNQNTK